MIATKHTGFSVQRRALRLLALGASSLMALATPGVALAEEAPDSEAAPDTSLNDIVVSARHRDERLQDVPLAISAIAGKELNDQHLDRLPDYAAKIPNFSAFATNPRVATVNIRGLGGNSNNDGAEGGVGVIVDDVFFTHVGFAWLDFVDLESVEVARGPQGTLLGKNTTIGAVVVRTAKPSFDPSLKVTGTIANHGRYQLRTNATGPLSDTIAFRLTFAGDTGGGWVKNKYDGEKLLDNNRWSVRGQLLFAPTDTISDRLIVEHYKFSEYNNHASPIQDLTSNLRLDNTVFSARPLNWTAAVSRLAPGYTPDLNGPQNANVDTLGRTRQRVTGISNILDVNLGGADLTSVTAYRGLWFRPQNDLDLTPLPAWHTGFDVDVDQYSQELRLASRTGGKTDWQAGIYYLHEDLVSDNQNRFYSGASAWYRIPAYTGLAPTSAALNGLTASRRGKITVDSGALFAQITHHLTDRFNITGGARYTRERKKLDVIGQALVGPNGVDDAALSATDLAFRNFILGPNVLGAPFSTRSLSSTGNYWSWLINPSYKLSDDALLYLNISQGAKSGAANTTATPALIAANKALIRPEKSFDIEFGIKSSWFRKALDINLNFYRNDITDYQASQIDPTTPLLGTILGNVGKVRLQGFELETRLHPVSWITLSANVARNNAKYRSYDTAPAPVEYQAYLATIQPGLPLNAAGQPVAAATTLSLTGHQVIGAPRWTANASIDIDLPVSNRVNLFAYVNESFRSRTAFINPHSQFGWQKAYGLTHAGLGFKSEPGNWSANLWAKNLFDKEYAISYGAPSAFTPLLKYFGEPRTWGLTVSKGF